VGVATEVTELWQEFLDLDLLPLASVLRFLYLPCIQYFIFWFRGSKCAIAQRLNLQIAIIPLVVRPCPDRILYSPLSSFVLLTSYCRLVNKKHLLK
jgi:hypothetical protein